VKLKGERGEDGKKGGEWRGWRGGGKGCVMAIGGMDASGILR